MSTHSEPDAGAAATFDGEVIDTTAVLVKYTYYGDTDFNGQVNFDEYSRIDTGFSTVRTGWLNGDFDGSGLAAGWRHRTPLAQHRGNEYTVAMRKRGKT